MTKPENKELTSKQEAFLESLFSNDFAFDYKKARDDAGYSRSTCPMKIANQLSAEILERTEHFLALHAPKSALKIVEMLDKPKPGAKLSMDAAKEILDRAGVVKKQQMENLSVLPSALLIIPEKNKD